MTAYSYYPGCSLHGTAADYDHSVRLVCRKLGITLKELKNWVCCGASAAHSTDHLLSLALPAHTLKQAEKAGLPLAVPCAMCFSRMKVTQHELKDARTREEVSQAIEDEAPTRATVKSMLEILADEALPVSVAKPLSGLKVACYYGCLLTRPPAVIGPDDAENPQTMEKLLKRLGAETVEWGLKTTCCGAGMVIPKLDIVKALSGKILALARTSGADCVAVACPMCHANLDMYQAEDPIPVFFFTQLLGLALGATPKDLHLSKHFTDPRPVLRSKGLG